MNAPLGSVTVPRMVPVICCGKAAGAKRKTQEHTRSAAECNKRFTHPPRRSRKGSSGNPADGAGVELSSTEIKKSEDYPRERRREAILRKDYAPGMRRGDGSAPQGRVRTQRDTESEGREQSGNHDEDDDGGE